MRLRVELEEVSHMKMLSNAAPSAATSGSAAAD
jgi:hypothetical protein